jgi:glycosyltransferase involved in cell wall biosynthesis
MNLAFVGFLPPGSVNPEERTFVELFSKFFARTVVFQAIGVRGLDLRHLGSLPSRLSRRHVTATASGLEAGLLPILPARTGLVAQVSARLIRRTLTRLTNGAFEDWVFWTRFPSPELVAAIRGLPFGRIVYEAVDHYAAEPEYSAGQRRRLEMAEAELSSRALIITASSGLAKRFETSPHGAYWLPIGQDARLRAIRSALLTAVGRPRLVVAGSLDELADDELLYQIATRRPQWQLVLAGPRHRKWGRKLDELPNVTWLGSLNPEEARGVVADCDVALNPCVLNEWTADALPVKVFDYLAEGKPIVSTHMSELKRFADLIELAPAVDFISAIERALKMDGAQAAARRRDTAARFTLQERARRAFELVTQARTEVLSQRPA